VVRDGLLGHRDLLGDLPDGTGPLPDARQDPPAIAVGQGAQGRIQLLRGLAHETK
jgi:hypothetical protein